MKTDRVIFTEEQIIAALALFKLKTQEAAEKMKEKEYKEQVRAEIYELCDVLGIARHEIQAFIETKRKGYSFVSYIENTVKDMIENK